MSSIEQMPTRHLSKSSEKSLLRRRLLDIIENTSTGTLLLCSVAGYGKSTLINQLLSRSNTAALCTLSDSDNDLQYFLKHLVEAFAQSISQLEIDEENESLLLQDIARLARENDLTVIFDNCQVIKEEKVCQAMQFLISAAENAFKLLMVSREIPDFAARFILENRCRLLQREDLALSASEVGEVVKIHLNAESPEIAGYLHTITGGWAVGVMFYLRGGTVPSEELGFREGFADLGLIKKYISYEIFSALPPAVLEFAKRAALLDRLSVDFCDTVLEISNSRECLSFLAENEIFLQQHPEEPSNFIWIDIFQRVLQDLLTTKQRNLIAAKTLEYYLKQKMYLEAINFALKLGQPALVCRALSICGTNLLAEEQFELLGKCAYLLENSSEEMDAFIFGTLAQYYYVVGNYKQMDYNFNMADSMFGKENIYSIQRILYRGLLKYKTDPPKYQKLVNNALFYLDEYNYKLPFLLPQETGILEEIKGLNSSEQEKHNEKPLKVQQFGTFKIIVAEDGYELSWRTRKSLELLSYLISLEGKPVDRNHLFDVIWPDELPNNHVAMLHNMIYNTRKELSAYKLEKLIQYRNKGYSVDMDILDCDAENISDICAAISRKDMDSLVENERLLYDYWGEYLENISSIWAAELREYYDKMFVDGSLLLADFYCEHRIYEKALIFLQNAQKIDIFSEGIMEKILHCYSQLGKYKSLRLKYDEFCALLENELAVPASAELKSAYQRAMKREI